jgi:hypothetical protein
VSTRTWYLLSTLAIVISLAMCGCAQPMTNDEIIAEVAKCKAADMDAVGLRSLASLDQIQRIECQPRKPNDRAR